MRYCGIVPGPEFQHLCTLEEVRTAEPPIRLRATFYEPGGVTPVVEQVRALGEAVVAIASPRAMSGRPGQPRACDAELRRRGITPQPPLDSGRELFAGLADLGVFEPDEDGPEGRVPDGAYHDAPVFETNVEGVFCALQGRRVPAKRNPLGIQRRIEELEQDRVLDDGGDLWFRRIDELEAAAAALCAHRYAVGHATWIGDPDEAVVVLPGSSLPERFGSEGVLPPVPRAPLRPAGAR